MDLSPLFRTRASGNCKIGLVTTGSPSGTLWIKERELHPYIIVDLIVVSENYIVVKLRVRLMLLNPLLF